eukprot:TRINITY_DN11996_c0_g1_i2.p1 TRINITY_DN11996_c0_g1~~TRINITY_DN11996_c0_g1_i2.p1  ORF type:complete len:280 (+),score=70.68 TRINITY_DN11996_c0_g1_i2:40-879(+)
MRRVLTRVARRAYCTETFQQHQAGNYQVPGGTLENPLSPEVLQQHIDSEKRWMEFSSKLDEARKTNDTPTIISVLDSGIELAAELGEDLRRPGYEATIHLEASHLHLSNSDLKEAAQRSSQAIESFKLDKDQPGLMRAKLFTANVEIKNNNASKIMDSLESIIEWCNVDSKKGTPIEQDAADKLLPLAKLALASAHVQMGEFDSARAILNEIIPDFANAKDVENTWNCLIVAEDCFMGTGDKTALRNALERQRNWAKRHDLEDRLANVEKKIASLEEKA